MASQSESTTLKSFVIDGSERSVQDIVSKLKFISKIKEGEIVDVTSLSLMEKGWSTSAYRTLVTRNESRKATLEFFRQVIGEAFDLAGRYLASKEVFFQEIGAIIVSALQECKAGISNHAKTYRDDRMHVSKIETLVKTLDTKSTDLQRRIVGLHSANPQRPAAQAPPSQTMPARVMDAPGVPPPAELGSSPPGAIPDPEAMVRQVRRRNRQNAPVEEEDE